MCWCAPGSRRMSATVIAPSSNCMRIVSMRRCGTCANRVAEAELVDQVQGGGVHGVAAEVPQEVLVLLQHGDLDTGAGHEQAEHHPGRATADDEAGRALFIRHALNLTLRRPEAQPADLVGCAAFG